MRIRIVEQVFARKKGKKSTLTSPEQELLAKMSAIMCNETLGASTEKQRYVLWYLKEVVNYTRLWQHVWSSLTWICHNLLDKHHSFSNIIAAQSWTRHSYLTACYSIWDFIIWNKHYCILSSSYVLVLVSHICSYVSIRILALMRIHIDIYTLTHTHTYTHTRTKIYRTIWND